MGDLALQGDVLRRGLLFDDGQKGFQDGLRRGGFHVESHFSRLDVRDDEEIVHQPFQPVGVPGDDIEEADRRFPVVQGAFLQGFDEPEDRRQGVRISWVTLATKSTRIRSSFFRRVTS